MCKITTKYFKLLIPLLLLATVVCAQPKYEVRAVWLTTIGGIDWPTSYAHDGMGIAAQKRQLTNMLDRLKQAGVNTVMLQTRVRATTIYPSQWNLGTAVSAASPAPVLATTPCNLPSTNVIVVVWNCTLG